MILMFRRVKNLIICAWRKFGLLLNRIFTPLILGSIYFLVLTPVALLYRLTNTTKKQGTNSFIERNKTFTAKDFENPW